MNVNSRIFFELEIKFRNRNFEKLLKVKEINKQNNINSKNVN